MRYLISAFPLTACLLALFCAAPVSAAGSGEGKGLHEIPDPELGLMRGRYTVGGNNVAWFGVTMISQWQVASGASLQGALTLGMDFSKGGSPQISFMPSVMVTAADAPLPMSAGRSVDSTGLANASGLVQAVQVAGNSNAARNEIALSVRQGQAPEQAGSGPGVATANVQGAHAVAQFDGNQARLLLQVDGVGAVQQWIRNGSVGQGIALTGDAQQVSNRLQIDLVRSNLAGSSPLNQNIAQAMALARGLGPGL